MTKLTIVDADGLIYLAGYAGEERSYDTVWENDQGDVTARTFESAADIKEYAKGNPKLEMLEKELVITPNPVEYSLRVVKNKLGEIQSKYPGAMRVYVKGNGVNFRDEVYQVQEYKGNRKTVKPLHYDAIIEYMVSRWDALRIDGKEVDDQCALDAREATVPTVVCSPDKDLDQIPGLHWNYTKAVEYEVDPLEAEMFFWEQMLSGDGADNILGVWKVGQKGAQTLVNTFYEEGYTQAQIWEAVVGRYALSQELDACPYKDLDARDVAIQTGRAIWMQDTINRLWTPPGADLEFMDIEEVDEWV